MGAGHFTATSLQRPFYSGTFYHKDILQRQVYSDPFTAGPFTTKTFYSGDFLLFIDLLIHLPKA